jgi:phospholipid transport system transporter-binding protein
MKTRKQKTPVSKRAHRRPSKHGKAGRAPAAARGKAAPTPAPLGTVADDGALTLGAECTVVEADAIKAQLAQRLQESACVTMDVTALQRIDTAGLQLLAAFVRDRRTAGLAVQWRGRAPALETAAGLLGLNDMLELPGEVSR